MANDVKTGIRLEANGEADFTKSVNNSADALKEFSDAAKDAKEQAGGLDAALQEAGQSYSRKQAGEEFAEQTAALAHGIATQAQTVFGVANAFFDAAEAAASYGDEIDKQSQKIGISRRGYQEWSYILGQNGADIKNLKTAFQQLMKVQEGLTKTAEDDLAAVGLSLDEIQSMSREQLFEAVIQGLQGMSEDSERAALAQRLLGSSYKELQPVLNITADEVEALRSRFYELGGYMDDAAVDAAAAYGDSIDDINFKLDSFKREILVGFLPALTRIRETVLSDDSLDKLGDSVAKLSDHAVGFVEYLADHGDQMITIIEGAGAAWATWKGAEIVKTLVGNVTELYAWLKQLGGFLGVGAGTAGAGLAVVGLSVATLADEAATLKSIGYIGDGHELQDYAANVAAFEQAIQEWHNTNDAYMASGYTEGLEQLQTQLSHLTTGLQHAQEEYAAAQQKQSEVTTQTPAAVASVADQSAAEVQTAAATMVTEVTASAGEIQDNWAQGVDGMADTAAQEVIAANDAMGQNMAVLSANAGVWGTDMMISLANGIASGANSYVLPAVDQVAQAIDSRIGFSEPDIGPLSHFHEFAPDMMELFARGITANAPLIRSAVTDAFDLGRYIQAPAAGGQSISYGGVNVTFQVQDGQDGRALFDEFSYWLQNQIANEGAVFAQ